MFRHSGRGRTFTHNLKLASILSTVAGIVNITGVLHLKTLTTNVTGHFAYFAEELFLEKYALALSYLLYIFFFLFGAFTSSLLMEALSKHKPQLGYVGPISLEIVLFLVLVQFSPTPFLLASTLLFAMGLQNALVTRVSQSVVRTTHLTGLFTDLGIELSQLFFRKDRASLKVNIILKLSIIAGFFVGCLLGAYTYFRWDLKTLLLPACMLFYALLYDTLRFRYYHLKKNYLKRHSGLP